MRASDEPSLRRHVREGVEAWYEVLHGGNHGGRNRPGIFVDVFPYDVLHSDEGVATRQIRRCRAWQSASYLLHARHVTVPHSGILGALERGACSVAHVGAKAFLSHERVVRSFEAWGASRFGAPRQ